jgi:hypothetical protein
MARRLNFNAATIATLTAVAAIVLGIIDSRQTRAHNRLSVAPYVVVDYSLSAQPDQTSFTVHLSNEGVGPAIVDSVKIVLPDSLGGGTFVNWGEVADLLRERGATVPSYWNYRQGEALGVQRSRDLIRIIVPDSLQESLLTPLYDMDVRVEYRSIYHQEFKTGLKR